MQSSKGETRMKNFGKLFIVCLATMIIVCGCNQGKQNDEESQIKENIDRAEESKYYLSIRNVDIRIGSKLDETIEKLGDDYTYFEADSCAFQGKDKIYTYGSVAILNYQVEGVDYIATIEIKDDLVSTNEGISIGSNRDDVISAYGNEGELTENSIMYVSGNTCLKFIMKENKVNYITYEIAKYGA